MLARLEGQALLSTEEPQDVPVRHSTLRRAIDWSYALLTVAERAAFRGLGVFVGWTLAAAEAVLQEPESASPVWPILGQLVDKSLVQAESFQEVLRYRMLQPIREYAVERLRQSGELDAARDRHARYFATLADQLEAASFGPQESTWFRQAAAEHENFRAAVRWAIERRDGELSLRLAGSLMPFWVWRGSLREGQRCLEEARTVGSEARPLLRANALAGEGGLAWHLGDYPKARTLLQEALALAEAIHDPALTARVLWRLGYVLALQGDASEARALLERSAALGREAERPGYAAFALVGLGRCFVLLDDLERAEAALNGGLDLARQNGSPRVIESALTDLAHLRLRREDYAGAATLASEALEVARAWESRGAIKATVVIAALVAGHRGDVEQAVRLVAAVDPVSNWGEVVPPYHDAVAIAELHARARKQMGDEAYRTAVADAQAMSVEQVAGLAQAHLEPPTARSGGRTAVPVAAPPRPLLSDRERAVLRLIGEGLPNKQIATSLSIAERTVRAHLTSAMNKVGAGNRAHAAVVAIQRGLL
jgi:DNA-binding NarL/FixJ family response regulator